MNISSEFERLSKHLQTLKDLIGEQDSDFISFVQEMLDIYMDVKFNLKRGDK